ncbi:MAG: cytochrome c3 family protein [Desulfobaccales bacterium]
MRSLMRSLLTLVCLLCLVSVCEGAWTELLQKEFPKTPWDQRPAVERNVCIDCHDSDLMRPEYKAIPAEWRKSVHYQNGVSCQDCHGGDSKDATRSMTPQSGFVGVPKPPDIPGFCGKCHLGIEKSYLESGHGKAFMTSGTGPNCVICHHSHDIQKASIEIINPKLCGLCHTYDRAREMKAALLLTEAKINEINSNLQTLNAGLIDTRDEQETLFRTQAEYRTMFHTVDVNLVKAKTTEFAIMLDALNQQVAKGFQELKFRQNFATLILLIFVGLGITVFLLGRPKE